MPIAARLRTREIERKLAMMADGQQVHRRPGFRIEDQVILLNCGKPFEEAGGQLDPPWPVSHAAWLIGRRLAPEFEDRFNGGWSFRKGIPVTRQRQAA